MAATMSYRGRTLLANRYSKLTGLDLTPDKLENEICLLEERACKGASTEIEVPMRETISGKAEFIFIPITFFDFEPIF